MNAAELRRHQRLSAGSELFSLYDLCRRRFLRAMRLVGGNIDALPQLTTLGVSENADMRPLLPPWEVICERYMLELFDAQLDLFAEGEPQLLIFTRFCHWKLFPVLVDDDECVRNILRAVGIIPSGSPDQAVASLTYYLSEMPLPPNVPSWMAREIRNI